MEIIATVVLELVCYIAVAGYAYYVGRMECYEECKHIIMNHSEECDKVIKECIAIVKLAERGERHAHGPQEVPEGLEEDSI